ncbi:MAG: hypothetical protein ABI856_18775, partial [Nitrospira sp.]
MLHPSHGYQVVETFEKAIPNAVFRGATRAGVMAYRHFCHGEAVHQCQGGKKSVHALEELQFVYDRAAKQFQRAAGVVYPISSDGATDG